MLEADGPRGHFEGELRHLRDRRLTMVDYWDIHNFGPEPASWDFGDWHHAVMGVQLGTDLGPVTVNWTSTFHPYGVEVFHEPIGHHIVLALRCLVPRVARSREVTCGRCARGAKGCGQNLSVAGHVAKFTDVGLSESAGLVRSRRRGPDETGPDAGESI
jgi:hypothetical protein